MTEPTHSPNRYPHGENHEEPVWKEMFKFWMNPQPNSLAWMESSRGEGE